MSSTKQYKGVLSVVPRDEGVSLEDQMIQILNQAGLTIKTLDDGSIEYSIREHFDDEFYRKYVVVDDVIYKVESMGDVSNDDIFEAHIRPDGKIGYHVMYYNGGCSFDEAINYSIKGMKEKP